MTNNCDNSFELDLFIPNKKPKETTSSHCICDGDYLNNIFTANQAKNEIDEEENYEESYQKRTTAVSDSHDLSESNQFLSSKTKRVTYYSEGIKKEITKQRNRESAKKCREKHKKEILSLVKQNQNLIKEITSLRKKICLLCVHCQAIFKEPPNEKPNFILQKEEQKTPTPSAFLKVKKIAFVTSVITLLCLFANVFSPINRIKRFIDNEVSNGIQIGRKLLAIENQKMEYRLKLDHFVYDEYPVDGPYISFGDYYSIFKKQNFLNNQYEVVQTKKLRFVNDTSVANLNMTECENCIVKIKKQNVKSKEDKMHFSIFYPGESNGTSFAFYEVDCMVVGYSKNKAVP